MGKWRSATAQFGEIAIAESEERKRREQQVHDDNQFERRLQLDKEKLELDRERFEYEKEHFQRQEDYLRRIERGVDNCLDYLKEIARKV